LSNYFSRLKGRLSKTRQAFSGGFDKLFTRKGPLDEELLEQIEELLITSDIGVRTSMDLIERIAAAKISSAEEVKTLLKRAIESLLTACASPEPQDTESPHVTLVVGVNGTGKTTTIGKLAATATRSGQKVLIAAGDTFRAAAIEQLQIWADRAGAQMIKHRENADPAAVAFDAASAALSRDIDLVLIDTAGRLHTKVNLMEELKKIKRSLAKKISAAPHEVLLVLDATTGQNALSQARLFKESLDVSGLVLTKLDGTAKGGIVVSICSELNIPIKYIGIGEDIDDLQAFDPRQFVEALI
jgi:fused signal recognition particle receptor